MPLKIIASQCTGCSACEPECPNVAITEKGGVFFINPKKCTECLGHFDEPQCTAVCPVEKFIRRMLRMSGAADSGFRLVVTPGGCSGLASEFSVESAPLPGDTVVEHRGMKFFVPELSRLLLAGVRI